MTRRGWTTAVMVAWATSLGWLVKRVFFLSTAARLAEAARSVAPSAVYYRLAVGGQQVGFASSTIDTSGSAIRVEDLLVLDVPALGVMRRTVARSRATLSRALRLQEVRVKFDGDIGRFTALGTVTGDTLLSVQLMAGRDTQVTLVPLTLVVADSADYDSTAMAWVPVHFDTVRAFRIDLDAGGMRGRAWVDAQGHIVRATNPVGFTIERSPFEIAYENFRRRDAVRAARATAAPGPGDVVAATAIAAGARLPPDTLAELRVRLTGADMRRLALTSSRQRLVADTLIVRRDSGAVLEARYELPASDTTLRAFLDPEPLIQSDNARIRGRALAVIGRERNPARAAELLARWVAANVADQVTASLPSAARALAGRRGDCNEHAVLYVALARAVGLPARTAAGLAYVDGRFYYHAWAEVYLGDWVAVDPTFDQFPADAAHLRFSTGGLARQAELVRLIGRLKLEAL